MSDSIVAAVLALLGYLNENHRLEVESIPGGGLLLSVTGDDHLMPWGYALVGIIGMAFIFMAIHRLAIKEAPKPLATKDAVWMPSPSFVSHMIAGSNMKEDQELQKMEEIVEDLEELLDAIDEAVEETRNTDEESRDSIAQEIIDVVNEDTSKPRRKENSPNPSPGEPIAKSTPNKEAAGNGMKIIKRVANKITMEYPSKK